MTQQGQIVTSYGRSFIVESGCERYECSTRGKRVDYACGDFVEISPQNRQQAVIERCLPRNNLLYRQDKWRSKLIAANIDQLLIVTAAIPTPSEEFLNRALVAAEAARITPQIIINKADLPETKAWLEKLTLYTMIGYSQIVLSALQSTEAVQSILHGKSSLLFGQSGMGKSTLLNALLPEAQARTAQISKALDTGRHTTTHACLYHINSQTHLIDSPGLQEFGLLHLAKSDLLHYFPEMRIYIGQCRFHNCTHRQEPGCAVKTACEDGKILKQRLLFLQKLTNELESNM